MSLQQGRGLSTAERACMVSDAVILGKQAARSSMELQVPPIMHERTHAR